MHRINYAGKREYHPQARDRTRSWAIRRYGVREVSKALLELWASTVMGYDRFFSDEQSECEPTGSEIQAALDYLYVGLVFILSCMVLLSLLSGLGFMYLSATLGLSITHVLASARTPFSGDLQRSFSLTPSCTTSSSDLQSLVSCHVSLVIKRELDSVTYASIQPTPSERHAWSETIQALVDAEGDCSIISQNLHESLKSSYIVLEVGEFCALVEISTIYNSAGNKTEYEKGWGIFVVPARKDYTKRNLHISAPHPTDDALTGEQAGHVFEKTRAKSLYIAGRARTAFRKQTNCITSTSTTYWKTDPAHDNEEMMFDTYKVILNWQDVQGGCSAESCAYIQLHGKGGKTCVTDQAFMSSGLGMSIIIMASIGVHIFPSFRP